MPCSRSIELLEGKIPEHIDVDGLFFAAYTFTTETDSDCIATYYYGLLYSLISTLLYLRVSDVFD